MVWLLVTWLHHIFILTPYHLSNFLGLYLFIWLLLSWFSFFSLVSPACGHLIILITYWFFFHLTNIDYYYNFKLFFPCEKNVPHLSIWTTPGWSPSSTLSFCFTYLSRICVNTNYYFDKWLKKIYSGLLGTGSSKQWVSLCAWMWVRPKQTNQPKPVDGEMLGSALSGAMRFSADLWVPLTAFLDRPHDSLLQYSTYHVSASGPVGADIFCSNRCTL